MMKSPYNCVEFSDEFLHITSVRSQQLNVLHCSLYKTGWYRQRLDGSDGRNYEKSYACNADPYNSFYRQISRST